MLLYHYFLNIFHAAYATIEKPAAACAIMPPTGTTGGGGGGGGGGAGEIDANIKL